MESEQRRRTIEEAQLVREDAQCRADLHFAAAHLWHDFHRWIGLPAAALAAVAGAAGLAGYPLVAGVLALSAAVLIAVTAFLEPDEKGSRNHYYASEYMYLENMARLFTEVEAHTLDEADRVIDELKDLLKRQAELNRASPHVPRLIYLKVRRGPGGTGQANVMRA